jgi:integrase
MAKSDVKGTRIRGSNRMYALNLRIPVALQKDFYKGKEWLREAIGTDSKVEASNAVTKAKADFILQSEELNRRATLATAFATLPPDQRAIFEEAGSAERLRAQYDRSATARAFLVAGGAITDMEDPTISQRGIAEAIHLAELTAFDASRVKEVKTLRALGHDIKDPDSFGFRELITSLEALNSVKPGTVARWRLVADRFIDFTGDLPLTSLTVDHLREFTIAYRKLPAQQNTIALRNLTFTEKVRVGTAQKITPLDEETIRQHIGAIKALMPLAISDGRLKVDPWTAFKIISPRQKQSEANAKKRLPFNAEMVKTTLADAATRDSGSVDRWAPMLAAYMGARQGEICQILGQNVHQKHGTWCIDLTDADDRQSVKNASSFRTVPVHQAVIDAGFIEYAQVCAPDEYLFQNETAKGLVPMMPNGKDQISIEFSGRFNRRLRKKLGNLDPRHTFQSYRHLFEDCATAVSMNLIHNLEIAGRSKQALGSKGDYGLGTRMKKLKRSIDKINPLVDLEMYDDEEDSLEG